MTAWLAPGYKRNNSPSTPCRLFLLEEWLRLKKHQNEAYWHRVSSPWHPWNTTVSFSRSAVVRSFGSLLTLYCPWPNYIRVARVWLCKIIRQIFLQSSEIYAGRELEALLTKISNVLAFHPAKLHQRLFPPPAEVEKLSAVKKLFQKKKGTEINSRHQS